MRLTLAFVLAAVAAIGCGARAPVLSVPTPSPSQAHIASGPMLGYATLREAAVWVQLDAPARVALAWWPLAEPERRELGPAVQADADSFLTAELAATLLEPGTEYGYDLVIDGVPAGLDLELETQPLWRWRTEPPDFTIAFGSCAYVNEARFDRPGTPYGDGFHIFDSIAAAEPDLMLWLGDNVYLREADWDSSTAMAWRYTHDRGLAELQPLLGSTRHIATWDDHDFGPNDADRSYVLASDARDLFDLFWANPPRNPRHDGIYTMFTWGDVDFFVLDTRTFRSPRDAPDDATKDLLGEAQLTWLIDALTASRAPFRVILTSSQFVNDAAFYETWARYSHERDALLAAIAERRIPGVVFLSGDRHHGELLVRTPEGGYPLYDFTSSPLTAGLGDARYELENPLRVDGTLILGQRNFGLLHVSGPREARVLTLEARDADGTTLWTHTIEATSLTFPASP